MVQPLWNTVCGSSKSERILNKDRKRHPDRHVGCSVIHDSQDMEISPVPMSRWVCQQNVPYTYAGLSLSLEKEGHSDTCYNVAGP